MTEKDLVGRYGLDTGHKLWGHLAEQTRNHLHVTHLRVCEIGIKEEERLFEEIEEEGCCGVWNREYELNGRRFRVGFNYGH